MSGKYSSLSISTCCTYSHCCLISESISASTTLSRLSSSLCRPYTFDDFTFVSVDVSSSFSSSRVFFGQVGMLWKNVQAGTVNTSAPSVMQLSNPLLVCNILMFNPLKMSAFSNLCENDIKSLSPCFSLPTNVMSCRICSTDIFDI